MLRAAALAALILALPVGTTAAPAPRMAIQSFAELQTPLPYPYDEAANADSDIAKAKARARREKKLLLVDLGGNWCGDCRILSATMERPELKAFVERHYVTVLVDVGRFDKNEQVPARWGASDWRNGVPALLVVDPRSGKLLDAGRVAALEDARNLTPQALADWLAQWTR
jgi:hypothetical protein